MAGSVLTSLLQQLSRLAHDEFLLVWNSKTELEKLHHTIASIKDIVQDAEQKWETDPKIARWLSRLRVEIYNADDFFDAISARILQKKAISGNKLLKEVRLFFSKSNNHLGLLISTARKVKQIRRCLDDLAKDIYDFGFLSTSHTEAPNPGMIRREEHSYVKADDIIGREKEKESLLNMLIADANDDDDGVLVLPISIITVVGMGGLGKTALAQLVFNEKHVQGHFELCLWACVNDFSNLNLALEKIVASGNMDRCEGLQLEQLQRMLRDMIGDKKYLLVLDDVWDDDLENWRRLKHLLDVGKNGSKILVTTRLKVIAQSLSPIGHLYLQGLSDEDAWSLFKKVAFDPNQYERIQRLEKIGRGIVKKCANAPLAVRIMGSFLHNKDESRWLYALNNEISQVHDKIMKVLKISYNDLPSSLKHCFAYSSQFPKDYEFRKDQLINIWMAQGFLESSDQQRNLEDIGDDCFSYLVERCFFQDVRTDEYGDIVSCKMHDLLHDLAVDVAGKECFMVKSNMNDFTESFRHLSYACYAKFAEENLLAFSQMEGLRTLLFHRGKDINFSFLDGQIFRLRCLRALDLSWLSMKELPSSIGMLVHLRYLDLSGNKELIKLPTSICKLQNLLTLKLNWCRSLKELPNGFKLLCLRHLELDTCDELAKMPSGLKEMTCLVTLSKFVVDKKSGGLRHLRLLNNLRGDLTIQLPGGGWENCVADAEESMLKSKTKLRRLNIQWSDPKEGPLSVFSESEAVLDHLQPPSNLRSLQVKRFPGRRISDWVSSLEHLIEIEISYCLSCVQLPPLRQLKDLKILELSQLPLVEYMENDICYDDIGSFFPSLETLDIDGMEKLKGWWSQEGVNTKNSAIRELAWFRPVSKVTVWNCPGLTDLPSFPYVEELGLRRVHGNLLKNTAVITSNWRRLKGLHIYQIEGSVSLPDDWAEAFSTLQTLYIERCSKLQPLSQHLITHLAALETLVVTECEEFNLVNGENEQELLLPSLKWMRLGLNRSHLLNGLDCLTALERLEIRFGNLSDKEDSMPLKLLILPPNITRLSIEKMKRQRLSYFSEAFGQLSKLEVLEFYYCEMDGRELNGIPWEALKALVHLTLYSLRNMEALPDRCRRLYSLQRLELNIGFCDRFKSLPDWITRIKQLRIKECGQVSEQCKNLTGSCWPQISHIPDVQVS